MVCRGRRGRATREDARAARRVGGGNRAGGVGEESEPHEPSAPTDAPAAAAPAASVAAGPRRSIRTSAIIARHRRGHRAGAARPAVRPSAWSRAGVAAAGSGRGEVDETSDDIRTRRSNARLRHRPRRVPPRDGSAATWCDPRTRRPGAERMLAELTRSRLSRRLRRPASSTWARRDAAGAPPGSGTPTLWRWPRPSRLAGRGRVAFEEATSRRRAAPRRSRMPRRRSFRAPRSSPGHELAESTLATTARGWP